MLRAKLRRVWFSWAVFLHDLDYRLLPVLARLPLPLGYSLAALRGRLNALLGRDWRSVALETRHVFRQSTLGYCQLFPDASVAQIRALVRQRFKVESRDEFEARLIAADRVSELKNTIIPEQEAKACLTQKKGLVLLTPHFDSFIMGTVLLGQAGMKINIMTSEVSADARLSPAVRHHFYEKYRGMEHYMNGGKVLDKEIGLRPFYQMLERGECLVILADAPADTGGARCTPYFLGSRRAMAAGAIRMAKKTGSDFGGYVCRYTGSSQYEVEIGPIFSSSDEQTLDSVYAFLSEAIIAEPGKWWASDLLPAMLPVEAIKDQKP